MSKSRRGHTPGFKKQVTLAAIKEELAMESSGFRSYRRWIL